MRIVFFIPSLNNCGGVEKATINLMNALSLFNGVKVSVILFDEFENKNFFLNPEVSIIVLGVNNYKRQYFKVIRGIYKNLKNNADFFVTVESMSLIFGFIPTLFLSDKVKLVVWEHFNFKNNNGRKARDWLRFLSAKQADLIVLLTERDKEEWLNNISVKSDIKCIYNIDPLGLNNVEYDFNSKSVLAVGRYVSVKGFDRLIEIWGRFQSKYEIYDWELNIVGYGEGKEYLTSLIVERKVNNLYLLSTNDVSKYYKRSSFYCMTSYYEGLPMVLIEAQAFGLPAISFDIFTGPSEILVNSSGILVEDGDIEKYVDAIYKLVSQPELRKEMSLNAFEASKRFSGENIAKQWLSVLSNV